MNSTDNNFDLIVLIGEHHATVFRAEGTSPARYLARIPQTKSVPPTTLAAVVGRLATSGYRRVLVVQAVKVPHELELTLDIPVVRLPAPAILESALRMHRSGQPAPAEVPISPVPQPIPEAPNSVRL